MLINFSYNYNEGEILCKSLCDIFYTYLKMYMVLRQETFTDLDLEILEVNYLKKTLSINVNFLLLTIFMLLVVNKQILSGICGCIF